MCLLTNQSDFDNLGTIKKCLKNKGRTQMPKYNIDDKVIDTTKFIKGTGTITDVMSTPSTGSIRYHVDFKDTKESGWFREEELKVVEV